MNEVLTAPADNSYDAVPYRTLPYPFTHPRQLETLATLFGMEPPAITSCRVLEIGCAGGGNVIPMALDLPGSEFLAIDLSEKQIAAGTQTIRQLGLTNIELRQANILDIDENWGEFDYIIAHGIFSWIPHEVQEKLLEICATRLSPQGVSFISYNTYPGWHLANIVREMMCYHAAQFRAPQDKIAQAKAMLEFTAELCESNRAMGLFLKDEAEMLRKFDSDSYLFHEHLESHNQPLYFHQFVELADRAGLQYLAEADFHLMLLRNLPPKAQQTLGALPTLQQEQYMDFIRGRRFRKTLLCRREVRLNRNISADVMKRFHIALTAPAEIKHADIRTEAEATFRIGDGELNATCRLLKAAMIALQEIHPKSVPFQQLYLTALARVQAARPLGVGDPASSLSRLANGLMAAYSAGMLDVHLHPPRLTKEIRPRPSVCPLVRIQAGQNTLLTNGRHRTIALDRIGRFLVHRLDGCHDRAALTQCLREGIAAGEIEVEANGQVLADPSPGLLGDMVDQNLATFADAGLLVE